MIITVHCASMGRREDVIVNTETTTPKTAFEMASIDYASGQVSLGGIPLRAGELDQTFDALGVKSDCYLTSIVKADGAAI